MLDLLKFREVTLLQKLQKKTIELQKSGKTGFEAMMNHTAEIVQELAMAYGER
jgi:NTP pyrophosphatase (non-canonical NTP hydrolase)